MPGKYDDLKELIAKSCRMLGELDITKESLGHVSLRLEQPDRMLIKGKGPGEMGLRFTQPDDIILVDFQANKIEGRDDLQPPSESFIHIWQLKTRPDVQSVIHMHPENVIQLTIGEKPLLPIVGNRTRLPVMGVPIYPRSITITTDELGQDLARVMGNKPVCLMRGHGVTVVGDSVERATLETIDLNELCTMTYKAYVLGGPKPVLAEDIEARRDSRVAGVENRTRGNAGGRVGMMSRWRYFSALAEEKAGGGA
jgi:ribulose-5-phosphate 4-epimerase/fuculose-1-phosphate aldolase